MMGPGFCRVEVAGHPPGKIQEYLKADEVVPKLTELPATIVRLDAGELIVADGGVVVGWSDRWMNFAFDGTPAESSRNSM